VGKATISPSKASSQLSFLLAGLLLLLLARQCERSLLLLLLLPLARECERSWLLLLLLLRERGDRDLLRMRCKIWARRNASSVGYILGWFVTG
jgi:hypothetical protein